MFWLPGGGGGGVVRVTHGLTLAGDYLLLDRAHPATTNNQHRHGHTRSFMCSVSRASSAILGTVESSNFHFFQFKKLVGGCTELLDCLQSLIEAVKTSKHEFLLNKFTSHEIIKSFSQKAAQE